MSDRYKSVGFYIAFDGIETRLATHDFAADPYGLGGTYAATIVLDSLSSITRTLHRDRGYVEDGGVSLEVLATSTVLGLIRTRGGTETTLATAISDTTTTITLGSAAATYANGTDIYIGRETITLGTHTGSGTYTGCSRGAHGSLQVVHDAAAKISDVPLFWYTRAFTLHAVDLETYDVTSLFFGSLSASPTITDGRVALEGTGRINELFNRPLLSGFAEVRPVAASASSAGVALEMGGSDIYDLAPGDFGGHVRVEGAQGTGVYYFSDAEISGDTLTLRPGRALVWGTPPGILSASPGQVVLKQVAIVRGALGSQALQVMLSDTGSQVYDTLDVLPGRAPNTTSAPSQYVRRRTGAGLVASVHVDETAWLAMDVTQAELVTWLDEPTRLGDWLTDNILWRSGGYAYIDGDGLLSWARYRPSSIRSALTVYDAQTLSLDSSVNTVDDETAIVGRAELEANWDPIDRKFIRRVEVLFFDAQEYYGDRAGGVEIKSKGLNVTSARQTLGAASSIVEVEAYFDRHRARMSVGGRRTTLVLPWYRIATFVCGYRFALTDSRMASHESATLGVTERPYEVVGTTIDPGAGTLTIECDEVPTGWVITPSAEVASYDAGTKTITFSTTGRLGSGTMFSSAPGQLFPDDCTIRLWDASATPPFSSTTTGTVASVATNTITLTAAMAITPAAGDIVAVADGADTGNTNSAGADVQDFSFGADSDFLIGAGSGYERAGTRWT